MWKDFFYFSKGQRIGILTLIVLILLVLTADYTLPYFFPVTEKDGTAFLNEAERFKKSLQSRDSLRQVDWQRKYEERQRLYKESYKNRYHLASPAHINTYTLTVFDPNVTDSAGFVRLGLKPYIASNIQKYKKKGGVFRSCADFAKVYGISPEKFKELESYISIAEIKPAKNKDAVVATKRADIIVELNSADTTLLMQVKGIGRGYAKGIVRFRQMSGGFNSVDQLSEVYGMRPENLEVIRPYCKVNPTLIKKINVNIASVERLRAHPYLNFYKAKAIYELRRKKGRLNGLNDLAELTELTADDLLRLKPYLSFE